MSLIKFLFTIISSRLNSRPGLLWTSGMAVAVYMLIVRLLRYRNVKKIAKLDPYKLEDAHKITILTGSHDFKFLAESALELGLFQTFGIPSISKLLHKTQEFEKACPRRYNDTSMILTEISERYVQSERGTTALRRLNALHGKYNISNDDYLFTLGIFILCPARWIERYGFRPLHPHEKIAGHTYWKHIGEKMGIINIPETYEAMEEWWDDYEKKYMKYSEDNRKIADAVVSMFLSQVPSFMHPLGRWVIYAVIEKPHFLDAFNYPHPSPWFTSFVHGSLKAMGLFTRYFMLPRWKPGFRTPDHPTEEGTYVPQYPKFGDCYMKYGYRIEALGPEKYAKKKELGELYPDLFGKSKVKNEKAPDL